VKSSPKNVVSISPKIVAFTDGDQESTKCTICCDAEIKKWVSACLAETKSVGARRPSGKRVHDEMHRAFPGRGPRSANSTRAHLKEHEPEWDDWGNET